MWKVEQALERILGVAPAFMRPPYGNYNNLVRQVAKERNQSRACISYSTYFLQYFRVLVPDTDFLRRCSWLCFGN